MNRHLHILKSDVQEHLSMHVSTETALSYGSIPLTKGSDLNGNTQLEKNCKDIDN